MNEIEPDVADGEINQPGSLQFGGNPCFECCFDFKLPFRPQLEFIVDGLRASDNFVERLLSESSEWEDLIAGCLLPGERRIFDCFEHSLSDSV